MELQVYRTNQSTYQSKNFYELEKSRLESIRGVRYVNIPREIDSTKDFVLITNKSTVPKDLPEIILERTRLIIHPESSYKNLGIDLAKRNIPIIVGGPVKSHAAVEYVLSCLFHHFTPISEQYHWNESRTWDRKLLREQRALIIGYGHMGQLLHASLSALCSEVLVFDPYQAPQIKMHNFFQDWSTQLTKNIDLLIITASENEQNKGLLNEESLKLLDPEAVMINVSNPNILIEDTLIEFAKSNPKMTFYLDVFNKEPFLPGHMSNLKNIKKTSHIAGLYKNLDQSVIQFEYQVIQDFLESHSKGQAEEFRQQYKHCLLSNRIKDNLLI